MVSTVGYHINGIASAIVSFCRGIYACDPSVEITITSIDKVNDKYMPILNDCKVNILQIPKRKNLLKYYRALKKIAKSDNWDIIHIHGNSSTMVLECKAARANKHAKIIAHAHATGTKHPILHKLLKKSFNNKLDYAFACSKDAGNFAFNRDFDVVNNGMDINAYAFNLNARNLMREQLGLNNKIVCLHVGLFNYVKNQEFLVKCAEKLQQTHHFIFVGGGVNYQRINQLVKNMGLKNITFAGVQSDVAKYYSLADCFCLPSLQEAFGLVLVEAQINGLNCIASDSVSRYSLVDNNLVKYLPLDVDLWVDALKQAKIRTHFKQDLNKFSKFGYKFSGEQLLNTYKKVAEVKQNEKVV